MSFPTEPSANQTDWTESTPAARVEPDSSRKNTGYVEENPLPAKHFNWIMFSVDQWIKYFQSAINELKTRSETYELTTGDVQLTLKAIAPAGWIMMDDTSIGNAVSGATGRANADVQALYVLIWNNIIDAWAPVSGGRGANALSDFNAGKTLTLPKTLGRALAAAGSGSGLTARVLGAVVGAETHQLTEAELPEITVVQDAHTHTQNAHTHTQDAHTHIQNSHSHTQRYSTTGGTPVFPVGTASNTQGDAGQTSTETPTNQNTTATNQNTTAVNQNATATNQPFGSDDPHNNMQPTSFLNVMVRL